eukprot:scaffold130320_cov63-Phaeocystis_antarctica.AAC.3
MRAPKDASDTRAHELAARISGSSPVQRSGTGLLQGPALDIGSPSPRTINLVASPSIETTARVAPTVVGGRAVVVSPLIIVQSRAKLREGDIHEDNAWRGRRREDDFGVVSSAHGRGEAKLKLIVEPVGGQQQLQTPEVFSRVTQLLHEAQLLVEDDAETVFEVIDLTTRDSLSGAMAQQRRRANEPVLSEADRAGATLQCARTTVG